MHYGTGCPCRRAGSSTSGSACNTRDEIMTDRLIPFRRPSDLQQSPDEALIAAAAAGDNGALEELFQRHGDTVYRILSRLRTIDRRDLDDVVQTTFIEVRRSA